MEFKIGGHALVYATSKVEGDPTGIRWGNGLQRSGKEKSVH